jgi:hypothetical protein
MGLHQTKKLLHSKVNSYSTEEMAYRMGENLCQLYIWQEINNQNKQLKQLNSQRINNSINIWENELNRQFSKEEIQVANKYTKKSQHPWP